MSRSTNENDSSSCEPKHSPKNSFKAEDTKNSSNFKDTSDSTKSIESKNSFDSDSDEDVYFHPLITDYDVGMVVEGPPPLQACNSCRHFVIALYSKDKYFGTCQVNLPIINEDLIHENLDSSCWNFCLREDLLKLKIQRLRDQNANSSNKLHSK